ncbi:MAG: ABC transporter permease [Spirulina sp. DLM2.Bin59]|nr:MAG: ABC transporter permease [Spirulina sp. DLM2.Bin59]
MFDRIQTHWQTHLATATNRRRLNLAVLVIPATIWLFFFFVLPLLMVLLYSVLERGIYGGVNWQFTLSNYQRLLNPIYWGVLGRSLWLALFTTVACLLIGYPLAFFIASRPPQWRNTLLLLVIIPFWTNFLVRIYAWIIILRREGVINVLLSSLNLIDQPLDLLFNSFAVTIGLVYGYLPFMILPLYATIERFDFSLLDASQDLGANDLKTFVRIVLPLTLRGIVAGCLLVFIPAVGEFITPDILGGAKTIMMGNLVQNQFLGARHWPFGSVLSIVMIVIVLIPILIYFRIADEKLKAN